MASASSSGTPGNEVNVGMRNFLKLQNLFGASTSQIYRRHFVTLWNHYFRANSGEWQNTKDFVLEKFISGGIGKEIYDSCDEHQRRILQAGNISLWDLSLLLDVIKKLQNSLKNVASAGGIKFLAEEKLDETKNLWDEVDYQSRIIVDYENYENWMAKVLKMLEENGMSKEKIVTTAFFLEKPAEEIPELDDVGKLAAKLKDEGDQAFRKGEFEEALKFYTEAIELDGLPDELLGTLYSNRSICNIHLEKLEDSKFDAKCVMTLRPSWFKGYFRLARVFEEMALFNPASQFYMLAEVLAPENKEVAEAKESCKIKRDTLQLKSHMLGSRNWQRREKEILYQNPDGIALQKMWLREEDPLELYREGERFETGTWGYPQDYKRAAELYSKAASNGHPVGIHGLANLILEGKGMPKDVSKALEMYKQVAVMPSFQNDPRRGYMRYAAVHLAQTKLGTFYRRGENVPKDLELAISYYKKALGNGCHDAPIHLGFLYLIEQEKRSASLASSHFMMASYMGNVMAMEQLANIFLQIGTLGLPLVEAQMWWKLAVHCGSIEMKQQEHLFMKEELTPDFNPFDFRAKLKKKLESFEEFKDVMKEFDDPKFSFVWKVWDAAFNKFDGIPEDAERELCKAMKNF